MRPLQSAAIAFATGTAVLTGIGLVAFSVAWISLFPTLGILWLVGWLR